MFIGELEKLAKYKERIEVFRTVIEDKTASVELAAIRILGISKEDFEAINKKIIMKVKEWKNKIL